MSELIHRPTWYDEVAVEHATVMPAFNDLISLASETCLTAPSRVDRYVEDIRSEIEVTPESTLIRRLGLWGVRSALDISRHPIWFTYRSDLGKEDDTLLSSETTISAPRWYSAEIDPNVQSKIEAFGRAVLDEAFICLGEDALGKVKEFQAAEDKDSQMVILNWLTKRIDQIRLKTFPDQDDEHDKDVAERIENDFYHPARLSPRFIGQFPDIQLNPTCLGLSILASSFAQKAEADYVHAGVAESDGEYARRLYAYYLNKTIKKTAEKWGVEFPDIVIQKMEEIIIDNDQQRFSDRGYHAVMAMKLKNGKWAQTDPNYRRNVVMAEEPSEQMTELYDTLKSLERVVPGTEVMFDDMYALPLIYFDLFNEKFEDRLVDHQKIEEFLLMTEELDATSIVKRFIEPVLFGRSDDEVFTGLQKYFIDCMDDFIIAEERWTKGHYIKLKMMEVVENYIFPDAKDNYIACLSRCKTDDSYRSRRIEDIKLAPLYFMMKMVGDLTNSIIHDSAASHHPRLEVGLPAYRIGASVLSDFAALCGDELPPSFWLTYWPSHVSVTEHLPAQQSRHNKLGIVSNHAGTIDMSHLRYTKSYGIIDKFLEQLPTQEG